MARRRVLWQQSPMTRPLRYPNHWVFCVATLVVWLALGWPVLEALSTGAAIRNAPVPALWLVPFALFGAAVLGAMVLKERTGLRWTLLGVQLAAIVAMAVIVNW